MSSLLDRSAGAARTIAACIVLPLILLACGDLPDLRSDDSGTTTDAQVAGGPSSEGSTEGNGNNPGSGGTKDGAPPTSGDSSTPPGPDASGPDSDASLTGDGGQSPESKPTDAMTPDTSIPACPDGGYAVDGGACVECLGDDDCDEGVCAERTCTLCTMERGCPEDSVCLVEVKPQDNRCVECLNGDAKCLTEEQSQTCVENVWEPKDCLNGCDIKEGTCNDTKPPGAACLRDNECASEKCVDNVCCVSDCSGECERCDVVGEEGNCVATTGDACGSGQVCSAGLCVDCLEGETEVCRDCGVRECESGGSWGSCAGNGQSSCDMRELTVCNGDGSETTVPCTECLVIEGTAQCVECQPEAEKKCGDCGISICSPVGQWGECVGNAPSRCDGNKLIDCNDDGMETQRTCSSVCMEKNGVGQCSGDCRPDDTAACGCGSQNCDANGAWGPCTATPSSSCVSATDVKTCDANGAERVKACEFVCNATTGQCDGVCSPRQTQDCGACGVRVCSSVGEWGECAADPSSSCDGDELTVCNGDGTETKASCSECLVVEGTAQCVECQPEAVEDCGACGVSVCSSVGEWGECAAAPSSSCDGNELTVCNGDGTETQQTCSFVCNAETGQCGGVCSPGDNQDCGECGFRECGADGQWPSSCTGKTQTPAVFCVGDSSRTCGTEGNWEDTVCPWVCDNSTGQCGGDCKPGSPASSCGDCGTRSCTNSGDWGACAGDDRADTCLNSTTIQSCGGDGLFDTAACSPGAECSGAECLKSDGELCSLSADCLSGICRTYFVDFDSDGFGDPDRIERYCTAAPSGRLEELSNNGNDCCDSDQWAKPGQTEYQEVETACGGYDYDCVGGATVKYPQAACVKSDEGARCAVHGNAWSGLNVPECGVTGTWIARCETHNTPGDIDQFCATFGGVPRTQSCK